MVKDSKPSEKTKKEKSTTQRVDMETLSRIKKISYDLLIEKEINLSQTEIISWALKFALRNEEHFLEYVDTGEISDDETVFDTIVRVTGKPWFPYGNLVDI